MKTDFDSFVNYLTVFLDRTGPWFLLGDALAHFVCSGTIDQCARVEIGLLEPDAARLKERFESFGVQPRSIGDDCFEFDRDGYTVQLQCYHHSRKDLYACGARGRQLRLCHIRANQEEADDLRNKRPDMSGGGFWRRQIDESSAISLSLPYQYGTILDLTRPGWYLWAPRRPFPTNGDIFFDKDRRANGRKLIGGLYNAAAQAGWPSDRLFIGFGTLLGYIMFGDFIPKDRDMDMCILSDRLGVDQIDSYAAHAYAVDSVKPSRWETSKRDDNGKMLWFSVGYKNPVSESGVKSCNWFFYHWNGFWWHSKGGRWVNPRKINQIKVGYSMSDSAIGLGLPLECITGLEEVDFAGVRVNIPTTPGMCLDVWYPGWSPTGEGASAHQNVMIVGKWDDENTWRLA